jgi:CheY-like chemotaxis protein
MILLVEDDSSIREVFAEILGIEGYLVEEAENGRAALDLLLNTPAPRLVLLDMMMPVMTGGELLAAIHPVKRLALVPVVAFSAGNVSATELHGARRFVKKPFPFETLVSLAREFCSPGEPKPRR